MTAHDPPEHNARLASYSVGKARSLCRIALRGHPDAEKRYREYVSDYEEEKRSYGASFRAVEKGGRSGSAE